MTLTEAIALVEHASPMPHLAGQALRVLRDEIARIKAGVVPLEGVDANVSHTRLVRPPWRTEFITCTCGATEKDACTCIAAPVAEPMAQHPDDHHVEMFADDMKRKLATARAKGRGGWDGDEPGMQQRLSDMLRAHVLKGDPCDVANFAMFLHQRGESILPAQRERANAAEHQPAKPYAVDAQNSLNGKLRCLRSLLHQIGATVASDAVGQAMDKLEDHAAMTASAPQEPANG